MIEKKQNSLENTPQPLTDNKLQEQLAKLEAGSQETEQKILALLSEKTKMLDATIETDPAKPLENSNKARESYFELLNVIKKIKNPKEGSKKELEKKKNEYVIAKQNYITKLLGNDPNLNRPKVLEFLKKEAEYEIEQEGGVRRGVSNALGKWEKWGVTQEDEKLNKREKIKNWFRRSTKSLLSIGLMSGVYAGFRQADAVTYIGQRMMIGLGIASLTEAVSTKTKNKIIISLVGAGAIGTFTFFTGGGALIPALIAAGYSLGGSVAGFLTGAEAEKGIHKLGFSEKALTEKAKELKKTEVNIKNFNECEKEIKNLLKKEEMSKIWRFFTKQATTIATSSAIMGVSYAITGGNDTTGEKTTEDIKTDTTNTQKEAEIDIPKVIQATPTQQEVVVETGTMGIEKTEPTPAEQADFPKKLTGWEESKEAIKNLGNLGMKPVNLGIDPESMKIETDPISHTLEKTFSNFSQETEAGVEKVVVDENAVVHAADAKTGMGGGVTYAFKEQLLADTKFAEELKTQMRYDGEINTPEFYKATGEHFGYIDEHGHEVRIQGGAQENIAYQFDRDTDGKIIVNEIILDDTDKTHGVIHETHHAHDKFETEIENKEPYKYEYNDGKEHHYKDGQEVGGHKTDDTTHLKLSQESAEKEMLVEKVRETDEKEEKNKEQVEKILNDYKFENKDNTIKLSWGHLETQMRFVYGTNGEVLGINLDDNYSLGIDRKIFANSFLNTEEMAITKENFERSEIKIINEKLEKLFLYDQFLEEIDKQNTATTETDEYQFLANQKIQLEKDILTHYGPVFKENIVSPENLDLWKNDGLTGDELKKISFIIEENREINFNGIDSYYRELILDKPISEILEFESNDQGRNLQKYIYELEKETGLKHNREETLREFEERTLKFTARFHPEELSDLKLKTTEELSEIKRPEQLQELKDYAEQHGYKLTDEQVREAGNEYKKITYAIFNNENKWNEWMTIKDKPVTEFINLKENETTSAEQKYLVSVLNMLQEETGVNKREGWFSPPKQVDDYMLEAFLKAESEGKLSDVLNKIENLQEKSLQDTGAIESSKGYSLKQNNSDIIEKAQK